MTQYELKWNYIRNNPEGHFFDRQTLKFFGERMADMYVYKKKSIINGRECYCLRSKQYNAPGGMRIKYSYFATDNFEYIPV